MVRSYNLLLSEEQKEEIVKSYINNHLSIREIGRKYKIKSKEFIRRLLGNRVRSVRESLLYVKDKYPHCHKINEKTRQKQREQRLKYMKEHPEKTG